MAAHLFEVASYDQLGRHILGSRSTIRCFDVSRFFIGLGTSTGDVLIIARVSRQLLRRVSAATARIDRVAFNPENDNVVCAASSRGEVIVIEHNAPNASNAAAAPPPPHCPAEHLFCSDAHEGSSVTQLLWTKSGSRFVAGDDRGLVSVTDLYAVNDAVLFEMSPTSVLTLDSRIVQIDTCRERLLISTLTATYLCDLNDQRFTKVGRKQRNGAFGACFSGAPPEAAGSGYPDVFCARPGGRLWKANQVGAVECTLNLRHGCSTDRDHAPLTLAGPRTPHGYSRFEEKVQFGSLLPLDEFLVTFTVDALYVLQVYGGCETPRVPWQTTQFRGKRGIVEAKTHRTSLFLLHADGGSLTEWEFALDVLRNPFYILRTPEQRLSVLVERIDVPQASLYLDLIRRQQYRGKEVTLRTKHLQVQTYVARRPHLPQISVKAFLAALRYLEGIRWSQDKRRYEMGFFIRIDAPSDSESELLNYSGTSVSTSRLRADTTSLTSTALPNSTSNTSMYHQQQTISNRQLSTVDAAAATAVVKPESATRRAQRKLLDRIGQRIQKEIADSILFELSTSLWAAPHVLHGGHYIDRPLAGWGMRVDLSAVCDLCDERLVIDAIDEDILVHFCGHQFHASCSVTNAICCICMQNYDLNEHAAGAAADVHSHRVEFTN